MERGSKSKDFLEKQGYKNIKKRIYISLIILFITVVIILIYFLFFKTKVCNNEECFYSSLQKCNRVSWIKEDEQSVWTYSILENYDKNSCKIKVKLIKIKIGTIDSEKLEGKEMTCSVMKTEIQYPEKDISRCTGVLKEELQDILIKRMHDYLLKNVGDIKQEF